MAEPLPTHRSVLLIGRSLYLVAVEAGLRAEPGMAVQRLESWSPALMYGACAPDALIVDSMSAHAEAITALLSQYPQMLVIELPPNDVSTGRANVWRGEQRSVGSAQDLTKLISGR
ncbi:MAG: hypothetical protein IPK16_19635 [Anaerolineales bacterium]|nr:hypothetical protein [Anaerolineales bacterium]